MEADAVDFDSSFAPSRRSNRGRAAIGDKLHYGDLGPGTSSCGSNDSAAGSCDHPLNVEVANTVPGGTSIRFSVRIRDGLGTIIDNGFNWIVQ